MSYEVLARKWRPKNFTEMVGQETILQMLSNAINYKRLHHAYLFSGTRGVGKTSLARIFAKCLNCETNLTITPCQNCATCKNIDAGKFLDLLEIDAASRTRVEDTRDLLENIHYPPLQGRFKIYLIDEVHMLSTHSFNALLKTLEEPPAHVKFLLATTEPKRLPITILSRCLQFYLKPVSTEKIISHIKTILASENIAFEEDALGLLANAAEGSVRDALSLLDQAIYLCEKNITASAMQNMLGLVKQTTLFSLLHALANQDGEALLTHINQLHENGVDYLAIFDQLLILLHEINVIQLIKKSTHEEINKLAALFAAEDIQLYYQIILQGRRDQAFAPNPLLAFEMTMLRCLAFKPKTDNYDAPPLKNTLPLPEKKAANITTKQNTLQKYQEITTEEYDTNQYWGKLIPQLKLTGLSKALAINCILSEKTADTIKLLLSESHAAMLNIKLTQRIELALSEHFNKKMHLTIDILDAKSKPNNPFEKTTPRQAALDTIENDADVKRIMATFDATLDPHSLKIVSKD